MNNASELNNLTHPHKDSEACCKIFLCLLIAIINQEGFNFVTSTKENFRYSSVQWLNKLEAGKYGRAIGEAWECDLNSLNPNRYVITTLALAIGAIYQAWDDGISPKEHYINTIHKCIRVGDDTDTTSAVAGAMVGAIYGEECLPDNIDKIHGYAGEKFEHVTYEDMVNTINALL